MTPIPPIPDWFILRALLLHDLDGLTDLQRESLTLHRWLLIKQGWAIGPVAMSQQSGLPISADIEAITLDGFDWASILEDEEGLAHALDLLATKKLTPSTWLLREILLNNQIEQLKTHSALHPSVDLAALAAHAASPPPFDLKETANAARTLVDQQRLRDALSLPSQQPTPTTKKTRKA